MLARPARALGQPEGVGRQEAPAGEADQLACVLGVALGAEVEGGAFSEGGEGVWVDGGVQAAGGEGEGLDGRVVDFFLVSSRSVFGVFFLVVCFGG